MKRPDEKTIKADLDQANYTARFQRIPPTLQKIYSDNPLVNAWLNFYLMGKCGYVECLEGLIGAMDCHVEELARISIKKADESDARFAKLIKNCTKGN